MSSAFQDDRERIDAIDRNIVELVSQRIIAARQIGASKGDDASALFRDVGRESDVYERWTRTAESEGLSSYYVGRILREILNYSRRVQEDFANAGDPNSARSITRVGFQGVPYSYSHLAAQKLFSCRESTDLDPIGFRTFTAAVDALLAGELNYALLPIENTIAGSINETYKLLNEKQIAIVDEEIWPVEHCLVGLKGANLDAIRTIRSHPVALQQCQTFLTRTAWASAEVYFDTAAAAESVASQADPTIAAICSNECAQELGLQVLESRVADQLLNFTRFVLVAREPEPADRRRPCKTSLHLAVCHRGGALADVLQAFARRGVNLTKLESRPQPESPWEYAFYVDVEGHQDDPVLAEALNEAREATNHLRILGTYPRRSHEIEEIPTKLRRNGNGSVSDASEKVELAASTEPPPVQAPAIIKPRARIAVRLGNAEFGESNFVVIAGPCAVENRKQVFDTATIVKDRGARALRGGAFKPRTSPDSFQGLGFSGVELLVEAGRAHELPVITEVLHTEDVDRVAELVDAVQVGARNMQNYALLKKLGTINKPVVLKRGMSATLDELLKAAEYITAGGNQRVIFCERGIRTFEPSTRSTLDISAVAVLRERTGLPVIVDPSHAPGRRELVLPLALAAAAAGADGLLVEVHSNPEEALCDGPQALTADDFEQLMTRLEPIVNSQGRSLT